MAFNIKHRTKTVEIILDQEKAEEINQLGVKLAQQSNRPRVSEAADPLVKQLAEQIKNLGKSAKSDTLALELKALPFSQWKDVLAENTVTKGEAKGMRDMLGIVKTSLPLMIVSATLGGKPVDEEDLEEDNLNALLDDLTDGQFTPVLETILDLNGKAADPKAAADLASKLLRN